MENFEQLFSILNTEAQKEKEGTYLDGLLVALEKWLDGELHVDVHNVSKEEIRKAIQISILKGMREGTQPNHQMTPDTFGFLLSFFVEQAFEEQLQAGQSIQVTDLAVGTGNLLYALMNAFDGKIEATGVEVDELLIQLAAATANLLEQPVELHHQDALTDLLIDPADAIVCDVPYGYYPNEDVALEYELCAPEGMSYAHHLFIEQSVNYVKEGGYMFFLVPATLFESEQAQQLHKYLKKHVWIQSVIQLPENLFTSRVHEKSILVLQKKSATMRAPKEVLLAKVPNMQNKEALAMFFEKVRMWKENK